MNKDNILIKIVSAFNEGIFSNIDYEMKVSEVVSRVLSYGGYDVSDCRFKVSNISGNLDICFIYDEVNTTETMEVINVDDARGTRIMVVIFVKNLLNKLRRVKPNQNYIFCYKIYDGSDNFLGYASKYEVKDGKVIIDQQNFDRKLPKNRAYQIPSNGEYINYLAEIFEYIVEMIRPTVPSEFITGRIYDAAPLVMALYSHKVTIGDVSDYDYKFYSFVEMVNKYDLLELLDGKILEAEK